MIRLAIIGSDSNSFSRKFLPVFRQLEAKVKIVGVYDARLTDATAVANLLAAETCRSFRKLVTRPDIDGLLMLSPVWSEEQTVLAAMEINKPIFCTLSVWESFSARRRLKEKFQQTGATVVVESEGRYWPSVLRTCELLVQSLGKPESILWNVDSGFSGLDEVAKELSSVLDAIFFLLQRTQIDYSYICDQVREKQFFDEQDVFASFGFSNGKEKNESVVPVGLRFRQCSMNSQNQKDQLTTEPLLSISCEQGMIEIISGLGLRWQLHGEEEFCEQLFTEQIGIARQIDHFCRHVSGGLLSLHTLSHISWNEKHSRKIAELLPG